MLNTEPDKMSLPISSKSRQYISRYHPELSDEDWNHWRWQMQNRLGTLEQIEKIIQLTDSERSALTDPKRNFPVSITPYMMALIDPVNHLDPIRRTLIPVEDEFVINEGEYRDPLGEDKHSPFPGLVHKYPDRALLLMTDRCPVYCRYCTRSRLVGGKADFSITKMQWQRSIDYIDEHQDIHDVLISGGDPFMFADDKLYWLLERLSQIDHLDYIRIGTKMPISLPQRFTSELIERLKHFHPLYLSIHVNHIDELTPESEYICQKLADAGIPLGS